MHPYRTAPPILPPPPRHIPWTVAAQLRFGGGLGTVGWCFVALGAVAATYLLQRSEVSTVTWFRGGIVREPGEIVTVERTSLEELDHTIYAIDATYVRDEQRRFVRSYTPSSSPPRVGDLVTVELDARQPSRARIAGLRTRPFSAIALGALLFPMIGLGLAAVQLRRSRRALELLRRGRVAWGELLEKQPTNVQINDRTVYRLVFAFEDEHERRHIVHARTHHPELLEDDEREQVLYHPDHPADATLVDHLPGSPRVDAQGRIGPGDPWKAFVAVALPVVAVVATVVMLVVA